MELSNKEEIIEFIKCDLKYFFLPDETDEQNAFTQKKSELSNYFSFFSNNFLQRETIRYQTMILTASVTLIAVELLQFSSLKLFGGNVPVSNGLTAFISILIFVLIIIFSIKAHIDFTINRIQSGVNDGSLIEISHTLETIIAKRGVDIHYWHEISQVISNFGIDSFNIRSKYFSDYTSVLEHIKIDNPQGYEEYALLNSEVKLHINKRKDFLSKIQSLLSKEFEAFEEELKKIKERDSLKESTMFYTANIEPAEVISKKWSEARDSLENEAISLLMKEPLIVTIMGNLTKSLNKAYTVKNISIKIEIWFTIIFGLAAIIFGLLKSTIL
jgi:hypothetical protein